MSYRNQRQVIIHTPTGERIITPEIVKDMLKRARVGMRGAYSHLERSAEEPGLSPETMQMVIGPASHPGAIHDATFIRYHHMNF